MKKLLKFHAVIVGEVLRRNALPKNDGEYLGWKVISDLYRIGSPMRTRYKNRFSDGGSLLHENGRRPFLSNANEAALMDAFKDTLSKQLKAAMVDIKETACTP